MKFLLLILMILIPFTGFGSNTDSLKNLLSKSEGKKRIQLTIKIMERTEREEPRSVLHYGDEALAYLKNYPDKKLEAEILCRKGWAYTYLNNSDSAKIFAEMTGQLSRSSHYEEGQVMEALLKSRISRNEGANDEALTYLEKANQINETLRDKSFEVKILNETGAIYRRLSKFNEALDLHTKALKLLQDQPDDDELRSTFTYLGIINDVLGKYDDALKYHHQSIEISKRLGDNRSVAGSFHNIGVLNQKIERYDESLEYYNRALGYWKTIDNKDGLAATLNSIGAVHELLGNFNEALDYYKQALSIWEHSATKYTLSIAFHNIGTSYFNLGNYSEALAYLQRALELRRSIQDKNGTAGSLIVLASVYDKLGKTEIAIATAKEGSAIADDIGSWSTIRHAHHVLAGIYENNGYHREALSEYKKYLAAHDSMFKSERQEVISELQEKYKSDEQRQKILILERDNQIQTLYRTILIVGVILLILFLLLLLNRYLLKRRAHNTLQKLHQSEVDRANLRTEAAESKAAIMQLQYDEKTKELNAARELQLSMLPSVIPQHNKIKIAAAMHTATEVGGDYYDFHKSDNGSLTIAIGDATGHGVKAGVMVTAVKSLFSHLAGEDDILNILCHSTQAIMKMKLNKLFMAFGLLRINDDILEAAGAGMPPVYIYRALKGEVETVSLKGLPLGIAQGNEYTKESVRLNKGDSVAVMSDGFPELFNKQKENLGYEKIPQLLKEAGEKSPEEIIKYFNSAASEWLDGSAQQDDMTFIVFKVIS